MKKHKKIYSLFFGFIFLTSLTGCMGAELIGEGVKIAAVVGYAAYKESQVDKYQINNYKIRMYDGEEGKKAVHWVVANDENGEKVASMYYDKSNMDHMRAFNNFRAMKNVEEKKEYLRESFLKVTKFDLGKEIERVRINDKYEVNICEVNTRDGKEYLFINVFKNKDDWQKVLKFNKSNPENIAEFDAYKKMNQMEKKKYLKKTFLELAKYDVGDVEEDPVKKEEASTTKETASAAGTGKNPE